MRKKEIPHEIVKYLMNEKLFQLFYVQTYIGILLDSAPLQTIFWRMFLYKIWFN